MEAGTGKAKVRLSEATSEDLAWIIELENSEAARAFVTQESADVHRAYLESSDARTLLIVDTDRDRAVGYLILVGLKAKPWRVELRRLVIAERSNGFGLAALQAVDGELCSTVDGHRRVWLDVLNHNSRAWRLYRRAGFQYEGCLPQADRFGDTLFLLSKELGKPAAPVLQIGVLEGQHVRLEPLSLEHLDGLAEFGLDPQLWRWIPERVQTRENLRAYVLQALGDEASGVSLPFAVRHLESGRIAGCTRFGALSAAHQRAEIGWTFYGTEFQRTACNTETKLLLLTHAFEVFGFERVELKTDSLNTRSRTAIQRLGAKEEGVLRSHINCWDGHRRDTVYYGLTQAEWPETKQRLTERLL